jgi:hypothetical protein
MIPVGDVRITIDPVRDTQAFGEAKRYRIAVYITEGQDRELGRYCGQAVGEKIVRPQWVRCDTREVNNEPAGVCPSSTEMDRVTNVTKSAIKGYQRHRSQNQQPR